MKISKFNGGINTRLDPSLLDSSEAILLNNANTTSNVLVSTRDFTDLNTEARGYSYKFKGSWVSSYLERSYVEYGGKLYYSEQASQPQKYDGLSSKNLGIQGPNGALNVSEVSATVSFTATKDISANSVNAQSIYFSPDGFLLYVLDATNDAVDQYELTIAWDIATASYIVGKTFSISAQEANATGMFFKPDGSKLYVIGNNRLVYQYNLTTAWDIATAVYTTALNATAQVTTPQGLYLSSDGTKVFIVDSTSPKVVSYTLSTPYDISTGASPVNISTAVDTAVRGLAFTYSGNRMYIVGITTDTVYEYTLSTAWDLSTAVYYGELANILVETTNATDICFSPDMLNMYIVAETANAEINQYKVNRISTTNSTLQYVYTYYNSVDGVESIPSEPSSEFNVKAVRSTSVSGFVASNDPQVDKIRLYRIGDNVTEFILVEEIPIATTVYRDGVPTTELTTIMDSDTYYPPATGAKYLCEAHGTFFYALGNKLYFSLPGKPDYWPTNYYIVFNRDITGILPYPDGVLVFGNSRTDIVYGTSASDFVKAAISDNIGCNSHSSCKYVSGLPIWSALEGFCTITSGRIKVVSKDKLGTKEFSVKNVAIDDETYWVCLNDGTLLAIDYRFDSTAFKTYSFSKPINNIYADAILYGVVEDEKLVELFTGSNNSLTYKSPVFIEDVYSETKLYDNVYVKFNGTFTLSILIDGVVVSSYSLSGNSYRELLVPEDKQRGNSIQFIVEGTGTFNEIEYKVQGRQNGR